MARRQGRQSGAETGAALKGVAWHRKAGVVTHVFTHFPLELVIYTASVPARTRAPEGMRWVPIATLAGEALPNVMRKVIAHGLDSSVVSLLTACCQQACVRNEPTTEVPMIKTALDELTAPPAQNCWAGICSTRGRRRLAQDRLRRQGGVLQSGRLRPGRHPLGHARRHDGPGGVGHDRRQALHDDHQPDREFSGPGEARADHGEAKVTQLGKTIAFVEGKLTAEDGTLLATATTIARLLDAAKADSRRYSSRGPAATARSAAWR